MNETTPQITFTRNSFHYKQRALSKIIWLLLQTWHYTNMIIINNVRMHPSMKILRNFTMFIIKILAFRRKQSPVKIFQ